MAKRQTNPLVADFLDIKPVVSKASQLCTNLVFDPIRPGFAYMIGSNLPVDRFLIANEFTSQTSFVGYSINPKAFIGFHKNVKKTKSVGQSENGIITIAADENEYADLGDGALIFKMYKIDNMEDVTFHYNLLFRDVDLTRKVLDAAISRNGFTWMSQDDLDDITKGNLVTLKDTNNIIMVSKALFGVTKTTERIGYQIVDEDMDSQVVLFCQQEIDKKTNQRFYIFTVSRYLLILI